MKVKEQTKTPFSADFWTPHDYARKGQLATVEQAESQFKILSRAESDLFRNDLDLIDQDGKSINRTLSSRVSRSAQRLRGIARFARINPWVNALLTGLDLYELWKAMGKDIPGGWETNNGSPYSINDCGAHTRWLKRQFDARLCGSEPNVNAATWNDHGPATTTNGAGDLVRLRWYGYRLLKIWGGGLHKIKSGVHIVEDLDPAIPNGVWQGMTFDQPTYREPSKTAPLFISDAPQPLIDTLDPFGMRHGVPAGTPTPVPYRLRPHRQRNPYRIDQRSAGYSLQVYNKPGPSDGVRLAAPRIEISAGAKGPEIQVGGSSGLPPVYKKFHRLGRPGKNEKESKVKSAPATAFYNLVNPAISTVTEAVDLVAALYDALPYEYKVKYPGTNYILRSASPQEKLAALYRGFEHVNVSKAIENVILNQLEDRIYGLIGQINADASAQALTGAGHIGIQSHTSAIPRPIKF